MIVLITFSFGTKNDEHILEEITGYFTCELPGIDPQNPCDQSRFQSLLNPELNCISYILLGLFPVVNLIFAVNAEEMKPWCACARNFSLISTSRESPSTGSASATIVNLERNDSNVAATSI